MLVTISGMVGSGKSTAAARVVRHLGQIGVAAETRRFQTLPCFAPLRPTVNRPRGNGADAAAPARRRWIGYRQQALTAVRAAGYAARILSFRAYTLFWNRHRVYVLDRYFYDNLVHYRLDTARQRLWYAALRALIPAPDVAFVLSADPATIATRCPNYSAEYLEPVSAAYLRLASLFPNLVPVRTDDDAAAERLEGVLDRQLAGRASRAGQRTSSGAASRR